MKIFCSHLFGKQKYVVCFRREDIGMIQWECVSSSTPEAFYRDVVHFHVCKRPKQPPAGWLHIMHQILGFEPGSTLYAHTPAVFPEWIDQWGAVLCLRTAYGRLNAATKSDFWWYYVCCSEVFLEIRLPEKVLWEEGWISPCKKNI